MSKFVVAVFPTEKDAYEGTRVMKNLQAEGSLTLYGMVVVTKAADGKLAVRETMTQGPLGAGVGSLLGGLVGVLGGPAAVLGGAAGGALLGGWSDLFNLGIGREFVDKVGRELTPGRSAVVAEVEEDWVIPLDTRMEAIGGTVLRQWRGDFEDEQIRQEVAADKAELGQLEAEYRQAREEHKARLKARIDEVRAKLRSAGERAREKRERLRKETEAKIKELQGRNAEAKAAAKAVDDRREKELRADYEQRAAKLQQAAELVDKALTP